jgi:HSP20 family protein
MRDPQKKEQIMPAKETNVAPAKAQPAARQESSATPFRTLERFADEVTRIFDDFGLGRGWSRVPTSGELMTWAPRVDVTQHKDELVIRVDLPGLEKDDVKVNVAEDAITIHGERHRAQEEERDGVYRTERNYGAFYRTIALPGGAITDQTKASFKNGVLEIRMPAAPSAEGRPLEIA